MSRTTTSHTKPQVNKGDRARRTASRPAAGETLTAAMLFAGLTLDDVDTINGCRQRLLGSAALLELGLSHMDSGEIGREPEEIRIALLDVVDRVREDVTLIATTIDLASARRFDGGAA